MSISTKTIISFTCACLATGLVGLAMAADTGAKAATDMTQQRQEMIQKRLDDTASRLEIKASQQAAWQTYASASKALAERGAMRPRVATPDTRDAATLARERADNATAVAQKLTTLADATATLQATLSPEQQKVFNEIARRSGPRGMRGDRMMGPRDGRRSGPMMPPAAPATSN
jgi:hypothetical protein